MRPHLGAEGRQALRRRYRRLRRALTATQQRRHAAAIQRQFLSSPLAWRYRRLAAFLGIDGEPNLRPLLAVLHRMRKLLALPVIDGQDGMAFYRYQPGLPLVRNRFNIEEPAPGAAWVHSNSLGLVLMPLVAFDESGNRLGMGGGYYDRHFGRYPGERRPLLVGVAHEAQRTDTLPAEPWDLPLDATLSEAGWRIFSRRLGTFSAQRN